MQNSLENIVFIINFHQQEQQTTQDLTTCNAAKAHDEERNAGFPVTILEGEENISKFKCNTLAKLGKRSADGFDAVPDARGNANDQAQQGIQEPVKLRQS